MRDVIASDLGPLRTALPREYFERFAAAVRKHVDIMDFSSAVPLLTLRYI
ncbi:hypothetical protein JJB99_08555 [Bradyrhizobium diazoefficiens]|nr:hypothetical protein [Bradyrhizobium diazoefficiens]QQO16184.1 hypothetical protein JJB99_08555 [Bradyrhizobium diazoefficiens]